MRCQQFKIAISNRFAIANEIDVHSMNREFDEEIESDLDPFLVRSKIDLHQKQSPISL